MANRVRRGKREIREAIEGSGGHIGVIASRLGVGRRTVYNYMDRWPDLEALRERERRSGRQEILELAETGLMQGLMMGDPRLIMFAIRHYDEMGPGARGLDALFPPDVLMMLERDGMVLSDVVNEFVAVMRMRSQAVERE